MRLSMAVTFVIAATTIVIGQSRNVEIQKLDQITDPDAYLIYTAVVPPLWATQSKDPLVLQRETETVVPCRSSVPITDPDWAAAEKSFKQENARPKLLRPVLPIKERYRLIPRTEIEADDARLAAKYPGNYNRRPESLEYAAVSAVGFNSGKTKAIVYVRLRSRGDLHLLERSNGQWVHVSVRGGCSWIVEGLAPLKGRPTF